MSQDYPHLTDKLRSALAQLAYLPAALRLVWTAAKGWSLAWGMLLILQGILPGAMVYLTRLLVDSVVAARAAGGSWQSVERVAVMAGIMAGILLLTELLKGVDEAVRVCQSSLIQDHISGLIHQKSVTVDLAFYETPQYHDHLHRARDEASSRSVALLESGGNLLQHLVTLLTIGAVLLPYGLWLPFVLLASALPALYVVVRYQWRHHQWWQQTTAERRWAEYYDWMLTYDEAAAEIRLFGLGTHFQSAYQELRRGLRKGQLNLIKKQSVAHLGAGVTALLISGSTMGWMVWQAVRGVATLGDLALFYYAFSRGQELIRSLLQNAGEMYVNILFLSNLFTFLEMESEIVDPRGARHSP
jgi:ATP-binding cassette subfamily B protein